MPKSKKTRIISVAAAFVVAAGSAVFAKQCTESIDVTYDNIKILIDGVEYTAKDVDGNAVEPFIYNGTTYLPVRGIANAFDKEVDWEPQTSTVIVGSKNYDWLDQIGYAKYETSGNYNTLTSWENGSKGTNGIKYDRGLKLLLGYGIGTKENNDGTRVSYQNIEYLLNGKYKSFNGKLLCAQYADNDQNVIVKLYGDGNLLYTSPPITKGTQPVDFEIDVSDCKILKISVNIPNLVVTSIYNSTKSLIGIVDARLEKIDK